MVATFTAGHFTFEFNTRDADPLCAKLQETPMVGRLFNLSEMRELLEAINACIEVMDEEQFSRDYDKEYADK